MVGERPVPFRLAMSSPGVLDNLALVEAARRPPGPGEVEIEVLAVGLNLREVLKALGVYPGEEVGDSGLSFDGDCAGKVVAVGAGVTQFEVGDAVVAQGPGVFASFATLPVFLAAPKPERLSFTAAATLPVALLTARYALRVLARLRAGERVLIQAAAGGVGLAAVQVSRQAGAQIFATAGSPEKREFLRGLGIAQVMDSRSLSFAEEILAVTGGRGVDVVLNSLAGPYLEKGLEALAPFGRFLELGKRDIYENRPLGLYPFHKNLTFFAIDLIQLPPARISSLFRNLMRQVERGLFQPLHHQVFPITEAVAAFRLMRRAGHIGKIVLSLQTRDEACC